MVSKPKSVIQKVRLPPRKAYPAVTIQSCLSHQDLPSAITKALKLKYNQGPFINHATLLVSPTLAPLAQDPLPVLSHFLKLWRRSVKKEEPQSESFTVAAAVIDGFRFPSSSLLSGPQEGLSIICTPRNLFESNLPSNDYGYDYSNVKERFVSVSTQLHRSVDGADQLMPIANVKIPLANTIFQTGEETTANAFSYSVHFDDTIRKIWKCSLRCLPLKLKIIDGTSHGNLFAGIVPLAPPMTVCSIMGNIVSQVSSHAELPSPASRELERYLTVYFETRQMEPQKVPIWAVIWPAGTHRYWREGRILGDTPSGIELEDFFRGATVHRVTSGGGGWSGSYGPLALDTGPTLAYEHIQVHEGRFSSIAKEGDLIQFFTLPDADGRDAMNHRYSRQSTIVHFGKLGSSESDTTISPALSDEEPKVFPGLFSAFSSEAIAFSSRKSNETRTDSVNLDIPGASIRLDLSATKKVGKYAKR